ncbi:acyl-CoA-binding protein [Penaeicola halotolerans]|uniref:acyl-CoA-binding protein n=1 Tax=Penaeicola halotolerans TaxID=2793196 RepID=UPI001CF8EA3E|nr:acyl-CoA-binding protein [Penaeicola halotolerans]
MTTQEQFEAAVAKSKTLTERPSNEDLLKIYSLFKQATEGDNKTERPGGFDFVAAAKYNAWAGLAGTSAEEAMQAYISLIEKLANK